MRKIIYATISIVLVLGLWLYQQHFAPLVAYAVKAQVADMDYQNAAEPDDFKLLFCGTGSPNRSVDRAQPCLALVAKGQLFIFDAGEGALAKLHEYQAPVAKLSHILLTHLHSDHISGVAELLHNSWLYGRSQGVTLTGPPGSQQLIDGIAMSYSADLKERMHMLAPDGVTTNNALAEVNEVAINHHNLTTVIKQDDLLIQAFKVAHPDWPYAYGYKISYQDKTIVISGDTTVSPGVAQHAQHADLLIHEASNTTLMHLIADEFDNTQNAIPGARLKRIAKVHTDTLDLAELAQRSQVKHLVLNHLIPALPHNFVTNRYFTAGMSERFSGEISVAYDGWWLNLNI